MGFYYLNYFTLLFLLALYACAIGLFWLAWTRGFKRRFNGAVVWVMVSAILVAPWSEEFWIAYNFVQNCKEAGTFIHRRVEVEGYYDGTGATITRLVGRPYGFIESPESSGKFFRVERANAEEKASAVTSYAAGRSGNISNSKDWITHRLNDRVRVTVEMDTGHAWRITTIDRPTARFHFVRSANHTTVSHKIKKHEVLVVDSKGTNGRLARYTRFSREAPWFFIAFDTPDFSCDAPGRWPRTAGTFLIDSLVFIPAKR